MLYLVYVAEMIYYVVIPSALLQNNCITLTVPVGSIFTKENQMLQKVARQSKAMCFRPNDIRPTAGT